MKSFLMPPSLDRQKCTEIKIPSSTTTLSSGGGAFGVTCPFIAREISPPRDLCSPTILPPASWLLLRHQVSGQFIVERNKSMAFHRVYHDLLQLQRASCMKHTGKIFFFNLLILLYLEHFTQIASIPVIRDYGLDV